MESHLDKSGGGKLCRSAFGEVGGQAQETSWTW